MAHDPLFYPPAFVSMDVVKQKEDDVSNSWKAVFISGSFTGLSIYLELSIGYVAPLTVLTIMIASCVYNEECRLDILKKTPLRDNSNSPTKYNNPLSSNSSISSNSTPQYRARLVSSLDISRFNASSCPSTNTPSDAASPQTRRRY